jgi:transcriptional regulator NrdR family protein
MQQVFIIKEDGATEVFDTRKLELSLLRAGAQPTMADKIVRTITEDLDKGVCDPDSENGGSCTVHQIYKKAFEMLKSISTSAAARYSLRRSIMEFGPTGFPFEEYIAEIFKAKQYQTLVDQVVLGGCVPHEVDVVAWNEQKLIMAEVKYHNEQGGKTDLKVSLYVKARYDDLSTTVFKYGDFPNRKIDEWWLITNTKFTDVAQKYGECKGLKLLSWVYPEGAGLLDMIEETKLHPITCLTTLTNTEKKELISKDIVLCKTIYEKRILLKEIGFSDEKIFTVFNEISEIINLVPQN